MIKKNMQAIQDRVRDHPTATLIRASSVMTGTMFGIVKYIEAHPGKDVVTYANKDVMLMAYADMDLTGRLELPNLDNPNQTLIFDGGILKENF